MEDGALPLPDLPLLAHPLGSVDFTFRQVLSDDAPFRLAGRAASVAGGARRGADEVRIGAARVAARVGVRGATGETAILTPVGLERRIRAGAARILERVAVPRDAGGCVFEWLSPEHDARVEIAWEAAWEAAAPLWRAFDRGLVVAGPGDAGAAFVLSEAPDAIMASEPAGSGRQGVRVRATARVRLRAGVPLRLAVAGGEGAALDRTLAALSRAGLTSALRGTAERAGREFVSLDAPDPDRVRDVAWAVYRLEARVAGPAATGAASPLEAALEALAAGAFRAAREALVAHRPGTPPDDADAAWLYLLLAARYVAWTGDLPTLRREWAGLLAVREAVDGPEDSTAEGVAPEASPRAGSALAELAEAAESIGEARAAEELRRSAEERGVGPWSANLGGGDGDGEAGALRRLVHGLLGAEPDAPRGRLVLRPAPPSDWDRFGVSRLRVGEAAVTVEYERAAGRHTFRLRQDRGGTPLRVILEPVLPGSQLRSATVDGVPAELDARQAGDKLVVPVQVVLDHAREVVLELDTRTEGERRQV